MMFWIVWIEHERISKWKSDFLGAIILIHAFHFWSRSFRKSTSDKTCQVNTIMASNASHNRDKARSQDLTLFVQDMMDQMVRLLATLQSFSTILPSNKFFTQNTWRIRNSRKLVNPLWAAWTRWMHVWMSSNKALAISWIKRDWSPSLLILVAVTVILKMYHQNQPPLQNLQRTDCISDARWTISMAKG